MTDAQNNPARDADKIPPPPVDAVAKVSLFEKNMTAVLSMTAPENGGRPADGELIRAALGAAGVTFGIDEEKLAELARDPKYGIDITIAAGRAAVNGTPASITHHFDTESSLRPKELDNGSVDFKDLGLVQNVAAGQLLSTKTPATEGTDGQTVRGETLAAKAGRDLVLPLGKNTVASEDGLGVLAAKEGHVTLVGGKVTVQDSFSIKDDISNATGNINFNGNLVIQGSVLTGFTVEATGDIAIKGACEAATIRAGGNVTIGEGGNGGTITAGGSVTSKYLQSCAVTCNGSVYASAIMHSTVNSGESIVLVGGQGSLVGGSCSAYKSVESTYIGAKNTYVPTQIEVGVDPILQSRSQEAPKELEKARHSITSLEQLVGLFTQLEAAGRLDAEKAEKLDSVRHTLSIEKARVAELQQEIEEMTEKIKGVGHGVVIARGNFSPGVRVIIGPHQMLVQSVLPSARIIRGESDLIVTSAV